MPLETVRVRVRTDEHPTPPGIEDVIVRFFESDGSTYVTQATTDADGWAEVTLNGDDPGIEYQLRFYVVGGSIQQPQAISVYSPASASPSGTNDFGVTGHMRTLPEATDPRLCRASVKVLGPDGRPKVGAEAHFIAMFSPIMSSGDVVLAERVATRSGKDGMLIVDLFRNCCYEATVEGHENIQRQIEVPDAPAVNLGDLLFPVVVAVTYDPAPSPSFTMFVGDSIVVTPTVYTSDGRTLTGVARDDLCYSVEDSSIAGVVVLSDTELRITGTGVGTTQLKVERRDNTIKRIPDGITGTPITIDVG